MKASKRVVHPVIVRENLPRKEGFQEKEVQTYNADGKMMPAVETAVGPFIEVLGNSSRALHDILTQ